MYSVILVDDEPAVLGYIMTIIEKKCPDYQVIATANDGAEALEKVKELKPDVLVFDICMPVLDGMEMSSKIKEWGLPVILIVVSGYSEFDYARTSLQNGVIEYLLKPLIPDDVRVLFDKIKIILDQQYYAERQILLRKMYRTDNISKEMLKKHFGIQKFYVALVRYNGLPTRFSAANAREIFSDRQEMLITYGRDEKETLYLCPADIIYHKSFKDVIKHLMNKEAAVAGYRTLILSHRAIAYNDICVVVNQLYQALNLNVILGKSHTVYLKDLRKKDVTISKAEEIILENISYYLKKHNYEKTASLLRELLVDWCTKERPLLWIEHQVRSIYLQLLHEQTEHQYDKGYMESEYAIEEAFSNAETMEQLILCVEEIMFRKNAEKKICRLDTAEFVLSVTNYIEKNLDHITGIQDIAQEFHISQTYLGSLFRKYKEISITTYLTKMRMEKAKLLILHNSDLLIKDVAERLGYRDQFYFSRVFRAYTGMCPSDFIDSINNQ